jgi:hypothetical protein
MTAALASSTSTASSPAASVRPATPTRPALRIVVRPAPQREPPFDDELDGPALVTPYDQRLPFEIQASEYRAPLPARPSGLIDPSTWARRLLVGLIESASGRRPLNQLNSLLSPSIGRGLGADFERAAQQRTPHWLHRATVGTVRASEPAEGVAELCATLETGRRVRAIAMRLEEQQGRWRCTRLQLG